MTNTPEHTPEEALIEELARALAVADRIEICSDASYRHSTYGIKAQAILPIIRACETDAAERLRLWIRGVITELEIAAADSDMRDHVSAFRDAGFAIRKLDVSSILTGAA